MRLEHEQKSGIIFVDFIHSVALRKITGNFLPKLLAKAAKIEVEDGMCVVQSFEPIPLYAAIADLGFEHLTEKVAEDEYRVYFSRVEKKETAFSGAGDKPLKPNAIINFKKIDSSLADIVVNFWKLTWGKETPAIDQKTKLLLSLANGVGAGRLRQATRELVKAYAMGTSVAELDELFSMFVWNGGVGTFASEIGPSSLFGAYQVSSQKPAATCCQRSVICVSVERYCSSGDKAIRLVGVKNFKLSEERSDEFLKFSRAAGWRPGWTRERNRNAYCAGLPELIENIPYQLIKTLKNKGKPRGEVMNVLLEKFGEKNPEVNVMPHG